MKPILLVEDNDYELEQAKSILTAQGYTLTMATNLRDGINLLKELDGKIVGVIFDLLIPEFYGKANLPLGLEVITLAVKKSLPVVACSSMSGSIADEWSNYIKKLANETGYPYGSVPFVTGTKDWQKAGEELKFLLNLK